MPSALRFVRDSLHERDRNFGKAAWHGGVNGGDDFPRTTIEIFRDPKFY